MRSSLSEQTKRQLPMDWNSTSVPFPDLCLHELVEAQVRRTPEATAVLYENESLSYREFNCRANQLARYLCSYGAPPETPVGIFLERSLNLAIAVLGVLKAGMVCVPLDPNYPTARLEFMLRDAHVPFILTTGSQLRLDTPGVPINVVASAIGEQDPQDLPQDTKPDNLAYIIYSSGSTGTPKGVMLPHRGLVNYLTNIATLFALQPSDRVLQFSSVSFDAAIEELFSAWISGATLVMRPNPLSFSGAALLEWIREQRISMLDLPTAFWHEWTYELADLKQPFPLCLRLVVVGGEKASVSAYNLWTEMAGKRIRWINTYGPTEASISATAYESPGELHSVLPIGRPLPNTRIYLLNEELGPVELGEIGELYIGGAGVARGYLHRPELTEERFVPDPFVAQSTARMYRTGDLARYLPDGNIDYVGRTDFQVKVRGFRVELGEIETVLEQQPVTAHAAVVLRDHNDDRKLIAYVVPVRGATPTHTELREFLKARLPEYMVPSHFVLLESMPLTPNGKIDRRALAELQSSSGHLTSPVISARDPVEATLLTLWEELFHRRPIGIRDNFFELGGHSLLAARLTHRIEQTCGKRLPISKLIQAPTIGQLAELVREGRRDGSSLVPIQPNGSRIPFFCVHGQGGNVLIFRHLAQHLAPDQPFYALQSRGLDGTCAFETRVEDMAAHYLSEICTVQSEGPYCLGGFSFGGLVAYEMARRLAVNGQQVGLVVLLDTYTHKLTPRSAFLVSMLLSPRREQLFQLPDAVLRTFHRTVDSFATPALQRKIREANKRAAQRYTPQPYVGRVALFQATKRPLRMKGDPYAIWRNLISDLEVFEIPDDHGGLLREPSVSLLAETLQRCIARALATRSSPALPVL
jgi:amino acid adenylation domain-containing protein